MKSLSQHINEAFEHVNEAKAIQFAAFDETFVKHWNYANGFKHDNEYPNGFIAHYLYINDESAGKTNMSVKDFISKHSKDKIEIVKVEKRKPYATAKSMHVVDFKLGGDTCSIYSKVKLAV